MDFACLEYINSKCCETHLPYREKLRDAAWLEHFCQRWELPVPDGSEQTIEILACFREELREMVLRLCVGRALSSGDIGTINACLLAGSPQKRLVVKNEGLCLVDQPQASGFERFLYGIALSFAQLVTQNPTRYLKQCRNPECGWIFYDDSKSHTKKWCGSRCASLMKVRRYRAQKRLRIRPAEDLAENE